MQFNYKFKDGFFKPEDILNNITLELNTILQTRTQINQDEIKLRFNTLSKITFSQTYTKNTILELQIQFLNFLIDYAQYYGSGETFKNIINQLEEKEIKEQISWKYPIEYKNIYAYSLIGKFHAFLDVTKDKFPIAELEYLLQAKFYLTSLIIDHLEEKQKLDELTLQNCRIALSTLLSQLKRWPETMYYIGQSVSKIAEFQINYLKSITLNCIREETCMNYDGLLLLSIIDCSEYYKSNVKLINPSLQEQMKDVNLSVRKICRGNKISITKLRKHKKHSKETKHPNNYELFCFENKLYLNEHGFYCGCRQSLKDDLIVKTSHPHTRIVWLNKYNQILEIIKSSYILSRTQYYKSLSSNGLRGYNLNSSNKSKESKIEFRNTLLKSSFRGLYSILDMIGISLLDTLNIDHKKILKERDQTANIYFLNMWDLELIDNKSMRRNPFIYTLYTYAKDLDRTKYSALKSFKQMRNSIEHKILIIDNTKNEKKVGDYHYIPYEILKKRTSILLQLTKSAIFTYTYYLRRESRFNSPVAHEYK